MLFRSYNIELEYSNNAKNTDLKILNINPYLKYFIFRRHSMLIMVKYAHNITKGSSDSLRR